MRRGCTCCEIRGGLRECPPRSQRRRRWLRGQSSPQPCENVAHVFRAPLPCELSTLPVASRGAQTATEGAIDIQAREMPCDFARILLATPAVNALAHEFHDCGGAPADHRLAV